ncbi:protein FAR1-RELATED SEQUENCE 5 [Prunus yedoensis var. nudiflora]|uniref:Protein FAR1-RELATED SEQUENCE 5 n=1 Tax=Prunus yedoensis var. nudiflora TaxID=2094558 RepID=A0A314Y1B6_PRUYE|nr:protein FAR1-RELATED SEQUENCE 5 [Prunus yedoensis var. nudiflora]
MQEGIEQYIMEVVPSSECEAKGVDSFVALGDEGYEHSVAEEVEAPVVLDDGKEGYVDFDLSQYIGGGVVEPTLGMEFTSEDDARNFYNAYAKQAGFSIRVNSYYRSKKDNSIISREFCCSKEGFRRERFAKKDSGEDAKRRRARALTREGCKALMTVRRRDCGRWYVAKLEKNHNHELVTPAMRHFLRSHKQEFAPEKSCSNSFSSPGLSLDAPVDVLTDCSSFGKMEFAVQSNVNYIGRGRSKTPLPVEKQGADIYTRNMFTIFQDEVFESLLFAVKLSAEDGGTSTYEANSQKGRNLQYNILYQEAIKCAEEGMASDHLFKVALNALREARVKIVGAKRNSMKSMPQN